MPFKTRTQIVQNVIKKIGLVSGTTVQTYTEPQVEVAVQDAFQMLFRKRYWEQMSDWHTFTLDGVNGKVTTDLTLICKGHEDAKQFHVPTNRNKIVVPVGMEHLDCGNGSVPLYVTPLKYTDADFLTRVFKFWPPTATGSVRMKIRTYPQDFTNQQLVPLPADVIEWAGAWLMLETDGLNPTASNKAQSMFQIAYNDYVSSISDSEIGHGGGRNAHAIW